MFTLQKLPGIPPLPRVKKAAPHRGEYCVAISKKHLHRRDSPWRYRLGIRVCTNYCTVSIFIFFNSPNLIDARCFSVFLSHPFS